MPDDVTSFDLYHLRLKDPPKRVMHKDCSGEITYNLDPLDATISYYTCEKCGQLWRTDLMEKWSEQTFKNNFYTSAPIDKTIYKMCFMPGRDTSPGYYYLRKATQDETWHYWSKK